MSPIIGEQDVFEREYTEKFRLLCCGQGEFIRYERDRAALDLGLHLTTPTAVGHSVSHRRIWFQLKGIREHTLPRSTLALAADVSLQVELDHLRSWFAAPEPVYLAVYLESADTFLVEDVREIVWRQWGENFLVPGMFPQDQRTITIKLRNDAVLTPERWTMMRLHQSMRIDGPFFRGRPLGHRLDPLRCVLNRLEPRVFVPVINRLLDLHHFRAAKTLDPTNLFAHDISQEHATLTCGRLYDTFQWEPQFLTEFGLDPNDDFRIEGEPQFAQGNCAVFLHGEPKSKPDPMALARFAEWMCQQQVEHLLVFANTDEKGYFGSFFAPLRTTRVKCTPQLLGEVAFHLLTMTVVYLEFREAVTWKLQNYLWR